MPANAVSLGVFNPLYKRGQTPVNFYKVYGTNLMEIIKKDTIDYGQIEIEGNKMIINVENITDK